MEAVDDPPAIHQAYSKGPISMSDPFITSHIQTLPLFARLSPEQIDRVAAAVQVLRFNPGDLVFQQGQTARGLYKFASGSAVLIQTGPDGHPRQIGAIGPNQYLNEAALLRPLQEAASLRAGEPAIVLLIAREALWDILAGAPDILASLPVAIPVEPRQPDPPPQTRRPLPVQPAPVHPPPGPINPERRRPEREPVALPPETSTGQPAARAFRSQRDDETVLLDVRRHWWAFARKIWLAVALVVVIFIVSAMFKSLGLALALDGLALVLGGLFVLYFYLEWRNDHLIVTDQRVLHIERTLRNLQTSISEVPLGSIQQVSAEQFTADPMSRVFGFGVVRLKTAGDAGNMLFTVVPDPQRVQRVIFEHKDRQRQEGDRSHRDSIRSDIDRVLRGEQPGAPGSGGSTPRPDVVATRWLMGRTSYLNAAGEAVYRKHYLVWLQQTLWPGLVMVAAALMFPAVLIVPGLNDLGLMGVGLSGFLFIIAALWFYWADWDWRNDLYIVGDETIRIIHKRPLWLQNDNDQILLNRIDNVVSDQSGIIQSMFDYGDVRLSLIGGDAGDAKVFRFVPAPQKVQAEITRRRDRLKNKSQDEQEARRRQEIAEYLSVYHETISGGQQPTQPAGTHNFTGQGAPPAQTNPPMPNDSFRPPNIPRKRG